MLKLQGVERQGVRGCNQCRGLLESGAIREVRSKRGDAAQRSVTRDIVDTSTDLHIVGLLHSASLAVTIACAIICLHSLPNDDDLHSVFGKSSVGTAKIQVLYDLIACEHDPSALDLGLALSSHRERESEVMLL